MNKELILFLPSIEKGGVEKNFFLIANFLQKKYKKISIVTSNTDYKDQFNKNINFISPNSYHWINKKRIIKTLIALILLIKNFFNKDIIILSFQSNIFAILIAKIFSFKIVIRLNTSTKKYINGSLKRLVFKLIYKLSDKIIVNSIYFKKELKTELNLNSCLIYNPFKPSTERKKINFFKKFRGLKILNIGRLTDQKNQILLLKSLNLLRKEKINFKCCIIGAGSKKKLLEKYIKFNDLSKFIKLIGYKKNAENYLNSADLFILTSNFEGLPNVLIEAQSRNLPIISSNCPTGPKEILLNGKLGDLFNIGDANKLFKLILKFSKKKFLLKKKTKLAKSYLKRFDFKLNCEKYYKILSNPKL